MGEIGLSLLIVALIYSAKVEKMFNLDCKLIILWSVPVYKMINLQCQLNIFSTFAE